MQQSAHIAKKRGGICVLDRILPSHRLRRDQIEPGARDDAALAQTREGCLEQVALVPFGAPYDLAFAGHHLQFLHAVNLRALCVCQGRASDRERTRDGKLRISC